MHKKSIGHLIGHIAYIGLYGVLIISTIIHYNSADLVELLYAGWIIMAFGIIFLLCSSKSRKRGHAEGIGLVERGMYAFVRHPEFLGHIHFCFGYYFTALDRFYCWRNINSAVSRNDRRRKEKHGKVWQCIHGLYEKSPKNKSNSRNYQAN